MQVARTAIRLFRSSTPFAHNFNVASPAIFSPENGKFATRSSVLGALSRTRSFTQLAYSNYTFLDREEVTNRVLELLKSISFVDPVKVTSTADFEKDLKLDMLDSIEIMMAVEEEFAVDIPNSEAEKFSTTAHLIDYITAHPQAK